jgi:hypothetical protein
MADVPNTGGTYTSPAQIGDKPQDIVKRWILELDLAEKAQKDWLKTCDRVIERYRGAKQKKNSFNILWSNTETMRQAVYNSLPKPDVRRRFRDEDPVGKVVSQVIERCADYSMDVYDFDQVLKLDLMDALLVGRGFSRVKYVPDLEDVEVDNSQDNPEKEVEQELQQRIKYEAVECEHVQYCDFRHGPGKTWEEVRWIAMAHDFSRNGGLEKFGDIFLKVQLDDVADESVNRADKANPEIGNLFKTARVWEIWDKDNKEVLFITKGYTGAPLLLTPDPLELDGFYPGPRPLFAIEDASSLIPIILFEQYKQQAEELDRVSSRINNLTDALKLRGVYNSVLSEIQQLQEAGDNQLLPVANVEYLIESGGLDKHIWYMPIEEAAKVIQILMAQREACKVVIYEITGIADIMRGATKERETLGAQQIKSQWGTQRLKKLQAEFQRYVRDIVRLKCQVIANKFQPETIISMTGLKLAMTDQEKEMIKEQAQAYEQFQKQQQMAQQQRPPQQTMRPA